MLPGRRARPNPLLSSFLPLGSAKVISSSHTAFLISKLLTPRSVSPGSRPTYRAASAATGPPWTAHVSPETSGRKPHLILAFPNLPLLGRHHLHQWLHHPLHCSSPDTLGWVLASLFLHSPRAVHPCVLKATFRMSPGPDDFSPSQRPPSCLEPPPSPTWFIVAASSLGSLSPPEPPVCPLHGLQRPFAKLQSNRSLLCLETFPRTSHHTSGKTRSSPLAVGWVMRPLDLIFHPSGPLWPQPLQSHYYGTEATLAGQGDEWL